ncbi:cupin domain-containing protein [Novosphingobium sp. fls2-241-R2A-195]|uniref:cupin domain-containing protein n=1 Tax=Novosphingobium sp. fls2-241-R2A-195 TaxID=3040296 RepID=UPI00254F68C2|nr:cupin domain-containing protein [Novosphingobium sp. fls2-241-R2A-195]
MTMTQTLNQAVNKARQMTEHIRSDDIPWLPYGPIPNSEWRVLQVDEEWNIVVMNYRMGPWVTTPVHGHHCAATAYTLEGEWFYDDYRFEAGDIAFEIGEETHQPITKDKGATLLTTLIGGKGNDRLLENHFPDGTTQMLRTRLFKACERLTPEEFAKLDLATLFD